MLLELTKNVNGFHTGQREGTGFYFLHYKDSVTLFLHLLPTLLGRSDWEIQTILLLGYKQRLSPEKDPLLILRSGVWGT